MREGRISAGYNFDYELQLGAKLYVYYTQACECVLYV